MGIRQLDWRLYHQLAQRCRQHVILGREGKHVDFCKRSVHVPVEGGEKRTTYESFEKGGFWLVQNRDDLGQTVHDRLTSTACFTALLAERMARCRRAGGR